MEEPEVESVLSLVPQYARTWLSKCQEAGRPWFYCAAVTALSKDRLGFNVGPGFARHTLESGVVQYECRAKWRSGSILIALTSGMRKSTLDAFEDICAQVSDLPSDGAMNWPVVLRTELLGFRGLNAPRFENSTALGMPTIHCTLNWGNAEFRLEAQSGPWRSRVQAFEDAISKARAIGPAPKANAPLKTVPPSKVINWVHAARVQTQNRVGQDQLDVVFLPAKYEGKLSCRIRWGRMLEHSVESFPMLNQDEAFTQAMQLFKGALGTQLPKAKIGITKPRVEDNVTHTLDIQANELLAHAKRLWNVERAWLMRAQLQTKDRVQRLHDLNTFLVLLDPLRCYEIDRAARDVAIGRFSSELQRVHSEQSKLNTSLRHAERLRALLGRRFAEAGTAATRTDVFDNLVMSRGVEPEHAIDELTKALLLRRLPDGTMSISTLGANLLERNLYAEVQAGSIGSSLPKAVALLLLNLKDTLAARTHGSSAP